MKRPLSVAVFAMGVVHLIDIHHEDDANGDDHVGDDHCGELDVLNFREMMVMGMLRRVIMMITMVNLMSS